MLVMAVEHKYPQGAALEREGLIEDHRDLVAICYLVLRLSPSTSKFVVGVTCLMLEILIEH